MSNNKTIEVQDNTNTEFAIPQEVRMIDELLNRLNETMIQDQGLLCECALMYIAHAVTHGEGDVEKLIELTKAMLDKYIAAIRVEHAICIEQLVKEGVQAPALSH